MRENIDIRIREDGSRVVSRDIRNIGKSADSTADSLDILKRAALAVGTAFAATKLMKWADDWGTAAGTIRIATKNLDAAAVAQNRLFDIAQRTRSDYGSVVELFGRASLATKDLGATQEQVMKFSEGVGKALAIQGTSANQAAGALIQLSQVLGSGKAEMQDYRSLIDTAPVILQTVAANIDGTGGSVARLTAMVRKGEITSREFFEAFLAGSGELDEKFAKTSTLFGQAWTVFSNGMTKYIGQLNESIGLSDKFTAFAQWLSTNMPVVGAVVAGVGVALAVAFAPGIIMSFVGAIGLLWAVLLANPIGALVAAIAGVITAVSMMRDEIKLGVDDTTTLGDLMRAMWEDIGPLIKSVAETVKSVMGFLTEELRNGFTYWTGITLDSTQRQESLWLGLLRTVAQVFDGIGAIIRATMLAVGRTIGIVIGGVVEGFRQMGKAAMAALKGDFDAVTVAAASFADNSKNVIADVGAAWGDSFRESFEAQADSGLESMLDKWIARAKELGAARTAVSPTAVVEPPSGGNLPTDPDKDALRKLAQLQRALDQLRDRADPVGAAMRDLARAQTVFNDAVAKGLIEQEEAAFYMARLTEQYEEQLDPLRFMNKEIERHQQWLKLSNDEARIEMELYDRVSYLKRQGIDLTNQEVEALRAKLVVTQELDRIAQARDAMQMDSSGGRMQQFMAEVEAMKQLLADAGSGFGSGDVFGQLQNLLPWANLEGTQEQMASFIQAHADMYAQIQALRDANAISEQTANTLRMQADYQMLEQRLSNQRQFFGNLASLSGSSNRKLAAIGKAAAITQATIDGVLAVQKALATPPGWPYNAANVITTGIMQAANVAAIASQPLPGFRTGGEFMVGGGGVSDSQMVAFRATPGERVTVTPPQQQGPDSERGSAASSAPPNLNVVVLQDPGLVGQYLQTPEGEEALVIALDRNGYRKN